MGQSRRQAVRRHRRFGNNDPFGLAPVDTTPSLPPASAPAEPPAGASPSIPVTSEMRVKATRAATMRLAGSTDDEIAKAMGVAVATVRNYIYLAGKQGWFEPLDPKDSIEYQLLPKAIKNLDEALDDNERNEKTRMKVKTQVALQLAEGTVFKRFQPAASELNPSTVVAIKVEMPSGPAPVAREGTIGGVSTYQDADVANGEEN